MANVDQIVIVMSLDLPPFDAMQATRFLVSAEIAEIPAVVLLNKADLLEDETTQALVAEVNDDSYSCLFQHEMQHSSIPQIEVPKMPDGLDYTLVYICYMLKAQSNIASVFVAHKQRKTWSLSHTADVCLASIYCMFDQFLPKQHEELAPRHLVSIAFCPMCTL